LAFDTLRWVVEAWSRSGSSAILNPSPDQAGTRTFSIRGRAGAWPQCQVL